MKYAFKMMAVVLALGMLVLQGCQTTVSNFIQSNKYTKLSNNIVCENVINKNGYHWNREASLRNLDCEVKQENKKFTKGKYPHIT